MVLGCNQLSESKDLTATKNSTVVSSDKEEIQKLIRQVLVWQESKNTIDLLPVLADNKDSIYIGFDLEKHKTNLGKLRETNFFAGEFIENYNQIILTLDRKMKNKEFDNWLVGDLPPFIFANDVNPWCLCQDVPYDKPNPWESVEVKFISFEKGKAVLTWTWGNSKWSKDFKYKVQVCKEGGRWKIIYLQGFDYLESTRKDGL